jgi:hypothetical protein
MGLIGVQSAQSREASTIATRSMTSGGGVLLPLGFVTFFVGFFGILVLGY